ncbi:helix-turn-helix domain-containing protein [Chloroflexota bacterium]
MKTNRNRFGDRVRELRLAKSLSQEELAFRAGIHRNYLGGIERGERNPCLNNIISIADVLGISPADFFSNYKKHKI